MYQKIKILVGIADALMYLHTKDPPLVSLILKPRSICLDKQFNSKITTTYYIVPESEQKQKVSATLPFPYATNYYECVNTKLNILSFGFIMWNVFNRKLFEGKEFQEMIRYQDRTKWRPNIPETDDPIENEYFEIMKECWNEDPKLRPTSKNSLFRLEKLLSKVKSK